MDMDMEMAITNNGRAGSFPAASIASSGRLLPAGQTVRSVLFAALAILGGHSVVAFAQTQALVTPLATFGPDTTTAGQLLLGPGDVIEVAVFATPELSAKLRIDQTGKVELPVGGPLQIDGLNPVQAAVAIETRLRDGKIMLNPRVTVSVVQYATQGISILGEVRIPSTITLFGPHTLYDALSTVGGTLPTSGSTITITHHRDPANPEVIQISSPNYSEVQRLTPVYPGDTIVVSKADSVYVVGDVRSPGPQAMSFGQHLSVLTVLAGSGGINPTAKVSKAIIIRKVPNGPPQSIPLNLNKIIRNEDPNILLEASDVLVVPRSGMKVFLESAIPALTSAASGAGAAAIIK